MTNPYQAPNSALPPSEGRRPLPGWVHTSISGVAFSLALLAFWGAAYFLMDHRDVLFDGTVAPLRLAGLFAMPGLLAMATGLFFFRRKIGVFLLAAYIVLSLVTAEDWTDGAYLASLLLLIALLAFGLHEYKRGLLR
ncbi:MAG: hypothetical protein ACTHOH_17735 [Lysobacteraceae bacterium]